MKDAPQKSTVMSPVALDASPASARLFLGDVAAPVMSSGKFSSGKNHSLASLSLALSLGATGLLVSESQSVHPAEAATLANSKTHRLFSQGETFMIPAPVTLAAAPEAQPVIESPQLVAAVSANSVSRVEPELPALKHMVAEAETLWSIAQRYGISVEAIAELNNLSTNSALTVGQAIKIPTQFNGRSVAALPQPQRTPARASVEVATIDPISQAVVEQGANLKTKEDEALSTLRAKQEDLAASIEQLRSQSKEAVVFDAEAAAPQPETLISSAALSNNNQAPEAINAPAGSVVLPVPQPNTANDAPKAEARPTTFMANNAVFTAKQLPTPPSVTRPTPELVQPKREESFEAARSVTLDVPANSGMASAPVPTQVSVPATVASRSINPTPANTLVAANLMPRTHVVTRGETLYAIARRYGISGSALIAANGLDNPNVLNVNQELVIPTPDQAAAPQTQSTFVALLPQTEVTQDVNRDSETLASAATLTQPETEVERPAITFEISTESAVNKLKDDIARMRQEYQQQQATKSVVAIAVDRPVEAPVVEFKINAGNAVVNPEWQGKQVEEPVQPVATVATPTPTTLNTLPAAPQEIAAASSQDVVNYNALLRLSVGDVVAPDVPALASPDEYLPGSNIFNGYIWPAKGTLTSGFGPRWGRMHRGIDIAAPVGTPIFAAAGGKVISAGWNSGGYGNLVKIQHSDGSVTLYAHNSRIMVRNGQEVKQGQQIAAMGSTGFSTGPHLHFEVHPKGESAKNPIAFLPSR